MILRRLTKSQKIEILEGYRTGETVNDLAIKFNCSANTISRTVKTLISDDEYKLLKEKRLRNNKKKAEKYSREVINQEIENKETILNEFKTQEDSQLANTKEDFEKEKMNQDYENNFSKLSGRSFTSLISRKYQEP